MNLDDVLQYTVLYLVQVLVPVLITYADNIADMRRVLANVNEQHIEHNGVSHDKKEELCSTVLYN